MKQIENELRLLQEQNIRLNEMIENNNNTIDILQHVLEDVRSPTTLLNKIMWIIAIKYEKSIEDLLSGNRRTEFAIPRRIAIMLIKDLLDIGYTRIGEYLKKTHPSILYQYNKWKKCLKNDENLLKEYNKLMEICRKAIFIKN